VPFIISCDGADNPAGAGWHAAGADGVFMMRWNVVIGGQAFSASFPDSWSIRFPSGPALLNYLKRVIRALSVIITPFVLFFLVTRILPVFGVKDSH